MKAHNLWKGELNHQGDFAAFIRSNQALIATAIAEIFPGPTTAMIDWLQAGKNDGPIDEPWEYVSGLILEDSAFTSRHLCVLGWILAAEWALCLIPEIRIESKARSLIRIIADGGWKSAFVDQSEWDSFQSHIENTSVRERALGELSSKGLSDPRSSVSLQALPWIGDLEADISDQVDPLMAIHNTTATDLRFYGKNLLMMNGQLSMKWPENSHTLGLLSCVNELAPKSRSGQITFGSPPLSFRTHRIHCSNGEVSTHLRYVSSCPPIIPKIMES